MASFRLPITYTDEPRSLDPQLREDLEFLASKDGERESLYAQVLGPREGLGARTFDLWSHHFSDDKQYLRDSQRLLAGALPEVPSDAASAAAAELCGRIEKHRSGKDTGESFHAQYQYLDWKPLAWLNQNSAFLGCLSAYNIGSPVLSLATPIFILLVPFVLLKARGHNLTLDRYKSVLRVAMRNHALGKLFDLKSASLEQRIYIAVSVGLYLFQVYQNVRSCIRFCANIKTVRKDISTVRGFLVEWRERGQALLGRTGKLKSFAAFNADLTAKLATAGKWVEALPDTGMKRDWLGKAVGLGSEMKAFYAIHQDPEARSVVSYALDCCGYVENLRGIKERMKSGAMHACKFTSKRTKFKGAYFPGAGDQPVKNSYSLDKHLLVTGPNAAGKTTLLKATLFNIILCQQIGAGFFKTAGVNPYRHIHCYINIPDTGGRDSLFQAEARRCKDILSSIDGGEPDERHFCVFDELYSGTNPYEAIGSAEAFLRYIGDSPHVSFIMTTHFLELCGRLDSHKRVKNCHMEAKCGESGMEYTYKLGKGVSRVKGGVEVLKELSYPAKVVCAAADTVEQLSI